MARSVPIWKILRFAKVSLYLERFVPRHATAHIHNVVGNTYRTHEKNCTFAETKNKVKIKCEK